MNQPFGTHAPADAKRNARVETPWTPGPWVVNAISARVDCGTLSKIGGLLPVAQMLWPTDERSENETFANAHLIAAAPCMAEALAMADAAIVALYTAISNGDGAAGGRFAEKDPAICAIRTALKRARGETL